mgnify:CR=1 FL=1
MVKSRGGRPRLNIPLEVLLDAVQRHGHILPAAKELHCSDAYIHGQFKQAGLTLADILAGNGPDTLTEAHEATR